MVQVIGILCNGSRGIIYLILWILWPLRARSHKEPGIISHDTNLVFPECSAWATEVLRSCLHKIPCCNNEIGQWTVFSNILLYIYQRFFYNPKYIYWQIGHKNIRCMIMCIKQAEIIMYVAFLTQCGLVTLHGDIDLSQHWLRLWPVAWWHQKLPAIFVFLQIFNEVLWPSPETNFRWSAQNINL